MISVLLPDDVCTRAHGPFLWVVLLALIHSLPLCSCEPQPTAGDSSSRPHVKKKKKKISHFCYLINADSGIFKWKQAEWKYPTRFATCLRERLIQFPKWPEAHLKSRFRSGECQVCYCAAPSRKTPAAFSKCTITAFFCFCGSIGWRLPKPGFEEMQWWANMSCF